jgi:hypothetical protein
VRLRGESQRRFKNIYIGVFGGGFLLHSWCVCMYVSQLLACFLSVLFSLVHLICGIG